MKVSAARPEELPWLVERTRYGLSPMAKAIKAEDSSGIRGMVAYDGWAPNSCLVHMAVDTPIACRALRGPAFEYPFQQLGLGVLVGMIPAHHKASWGMAQRLGFRRTHRVLDGWAPGDDLLVLEMRKEECPCL